MARVALYIVVVAPIPSARHNKAASVSPGLRASDRMAYVTSFLSESIEAPEWRSRDRHAPIQASRVPAHRSVQFVVAQYITAIAHTLGQRAIRRSGRQISQLRDRITGPPPTSRFGRFRHVFSTAMTYKSTSNVD